MDEQKPTSEDFARLFDLKESLAPFSTTLSEKALARPSPGSLRNSYVEDIYKKLETIQLLTIKFITPTKTLKKELWESLNNALTKLLETGKDFSVAFSNVSSLMEIIQRDNTAIFEPLHNVWLDTVVQKLPFIDHEIGEIIDIIDLTMHRWERHFSEDERKQIAAKVTTNNQLPSRYDKDSTK
jgi:hypothetical protein